jgi:hypothetical protein
MSLVNAICTTSYNTRTIGFKSRENAFFLESTIFGGHDANEEFIAVEVWLISDGWKPSNIVFLDVDWASQQVSFPRFNLQLKGGQSLKDIVADVKEKVNAIVGESTLNEYC